MSDSVQPHRRQPTRLPCPWDSPGKNTRVSCHFLLQCMKVKSESEVAQSCPTQRSHGLQPTRLLCPWDLPDKSTGVGKNMPCLHNSPKITYEIIFIKKKERKKVKLLSRVRLFETPWTVAYQASPSMGFSRQEYWSVVPLPSPAKSLLTGKDSDAGKD